MIKKLLACFLFYSFLVLGKADAQISVGTKLINFQKNWSLSRGIALQKSVDTKKIWPLPDNQGVSIDPDESVALASLTKPLTAMLVRKAVEKRHIELTDNMYKWFPDLSVKAKDQRFSDITVRQLLRHEAGFDRSQSGDPLVNHDGSINDCNKAIEIAVIDRMLDYESGTRFKYSNVGYCLLGEIIQKVNRESYFSVLQRSFPESSDDAREQFVPGRIKVSEMSVNHRADWRKFNSAGGFFATANAYIDFMGSEADEFSLIADKYKGVDDYYYGLGWRVTRFDDGLVLSHYGVFPGVFNYAAIYPTKCVALAFFHGRPIDDEKAARQLLSLLKC